MGNESTTYEDEMSQPVHRPGMEGVVNRGVDARDSSGNRTSADRPTVGPADSATRKAALDAALSGKPAPLQKAPSDEADEQAPASPGDSASGVGGRTREQTVMDQVAKAGG